MVGWTDHGMGGAHRKWEDLICRRAVANEKVVPLKVPFKVSVQPGGRIEPIGILCHCVSMIPCSNGT